ncbi:MAG: hypothetical protein KY445_04670 [Armatimonadetes bacterium]|nr:hypothetical protein [Armatimonadota bacterium]
MKKILTTLSCATWLLMPAFSAQAQNAPRDFDGPDRRDRDRFDGPRGPGRRGPGGDGPRGMWRRDNAHFRLGGLWRGIGALENSEAPLSKAQATQIVALTRPWGNRAQMSEADAQKLDGQLRALLTQSQKTALENRRFAGRPERGRRDRDFEGRRFERGPRGDAPPDGGRRDGGRRDGGPPERRRRDGGRRGEGRSAGFDPQKMEAMRAQLANLNPFYAPTGLKEWKTLPQPVQQRLVDRYKDSRGILEALSRKSKN